MDYVVFYLNVLCLCLSLSDQSLNLPKLNVEIETFRIQMFLVLSFFSRAGIAQLKHQTNLSNCLIWKLRSKLRYSVSQQVGRDPLLGRRYSVLGSQKLNYCNILVLYGSPHCVLFCFVGRQHPSVGNHWPRGLLDLIMNN